MLPRFSVIVNTYHRVSRLKETLAALLALRWSRYEIIVVTGPSEDGTLALVTALQEQHPNIQVCTCEVVNLAVSRNIGLSVASGDWIAFTDDDALPEPDWLCQFAAHIVGHQAIPLGAIGGFVYDHSGHAFQAEYLVADRFGNSQFHGVTIDQFPIASDPTSHHYPSLMGVNVCYARRALAQVGGFDPAFAYLLEETDLLLRLIKAGWQVHNVPSARVHHKYADSHIRTNKVVASYYHIMRSRLYFATKHALPIFGLAAFSRHIHHWLAEVREHSPHLVTEAHYAIQDAMQMSKSPFANSVVLPSIYPRAFIPIASAQPAANRLRLLLISSEFPPDKQGGIARFMEVLAKQLASQGHEITVIAQAEASAPATVDRLAEGYWLHRIHPLTAEAYEQLPPLNACPVLPEPIRGFAAAVWQETYRIQANRQFQAAIASIWNVESLYLVATNALPVFTYLVTSYHHMYAHYEGWKTAIAEQMMQAEDWLFERTHLIAGSQAIVADTYQVTQVHALLTARVIPFGLPDDVVEEVSVSKGQLDSDDHPKDQINLLFVGRFEPRKGIDLLLACVPRLLSTYPNLHITCIGNDQLPWHDMPPIKDTFMAEHPECLDRISFLGTVDDATLLSAYRRCDLFVAPSRYESFGLIFLEAMRAGKPCIGCRSGGMLEVINDQETGLLVRPDDAQELYASVALLLNNTELRHRLGRNARIAYEQNFTDRWFVQQLVLYLETRLCLVV